ncbi:MAG: hypothetical protein HGA90_06940 [Alphaproteobacteria bacterium]|nr:hypothetical protein [Alphaproteobacteria bacterium]
MRFVGFILRLVLLVALVVWLANQPGTARIVWHDYVIETSAAFLAVALVAAILALFALYRFWRFLTDGPRFWRLNRKLGLFQKGQKELDAALAALAGGDATEAGRCAIGARKLLGPTSTTSFLQAQAAQLAGDTNLARGIYRQLIENPDSAALGYRGLIMAAMRASDWEEAERLALDFQNLKPSTPWLGLIQFELAVRRRRWREANAGLAQAALARLISPARARQHQAALLLAVAETESQQEHVDQALQSAEKAARLAPDWVPALYALAQKQLTTGHIRAALRTIEKAWGVMPYPPLARLYVTSLRGRPLEARVVDMNYGQGALPAESFFDRLTLELAVWPGSNRRRARSGRVGVRVREALSQGFACDQLSQHTLTQLDVGALARRATEQAPQLHAIDRRWLT